jgi:hypothetical protein
MLDLSLALQRISRQMPHGDVTRWRAWHTCHMEAATDAVRDPDDRMPARVDTLRWATDFAKHPRSFLLNR